MKIGSVSRKEWKILQDTAEKDWHFELCKYDYTCMLHKLKLSCAYVRNLNECPRGYR